MSMNGLFKPCHPGLQQQLDHTWCHLNPPGGGGSLGLPTKPNKIPGPNINAQKKSNSKALKISRKQNKFGGKCRTTCKCWHYHQYSDSFEYPPKNPLKSSHPKNTCQILLSKKIRETKISNPKFFKPKNLNPFEIRHSPPPPPPLLLGLNESYSTMK